MKKKLDAANIVNELRGQSAFFPKEPQEHNNQEQQPPSSLSSEQHIPTVVKSDTTIPRYHDTLTPSNHDTMIPLDEKDILETVRRSVKRIGKEAATHRCTIEERLALDEIEYQYKRQGVRTSGNEITRIAVNYIVEDYRKNGENSVLAKVLQKLNS